MGARAGVFQARLCSPPGGRQASRPVASSTLGSDPRPLGHFLIEVKIL